MKTKDLLQSTQDPTQSISQHHEHYGFKISFNINS